MKESGEEEVEGGGEKRKIEEGEEEDKEEGVKRETRHRGGVGEWRRWRGVGGGGKQHRLFSYDYPILQAHKYRRYR